MKKSILILSCCLLLSFLSTRASGQESFKNQDPVEAQLVSLSVDFFKHMARSEYTDASVLFHYPKEYTSEKKLNKFLTSANCSKSSLMNLASHLTTKTIKILLSITTSQ